MLYKRFNDVIILRLDPAEEICASLIRLAEEEDIRAASVSGLGAINNFTIGVFDTAKKQFRPNQFQGDYEITSLVGTLTELDGKPCQHVHLSAGDSRGLVVGGHLKSAVVSVTAEIVVRVIDGDVRRKRDPETGLNLLDF
jgi:predicted DNA-binding protein with PD1-like motif